MMCDIKVGFFSLRKCGERPVGNCRTCSRPMCQRHLVEDPDGHLCSECAAKAREDHRNRDHWDRDTIHRRRREYYGSRGYRPHRHGGHSHRDHYDDQDTRDFAEAAAVGTAAEALDDDDGGDFFDS